MGHIIKIVVFSIVIYNMGVCSCWASWVKSYWYGTSDSKPKNTVTNEDPIPQPIRMNSSQDLISQPITTISNLDPLPQPTTKKVLCIDDGEPERLVYALTVLNDHELQNKRPDIRDSIHQIVGYGTGVLLAEYMWMCGDNGQKYRYSMREILNIFTYLIDAQGNLKDGKKMEENISHLSKSMPEKTVLILVQDKKTKAYWLQDAYQHQFSEPAQQTYSLKGDPDPLHLPWTVVESVKTRFLKDGQGMAFELLLLGLGISKADQSTQVTGNQAFKAILSCAQVVTPSIVSSLFELASTATEYQKKFHLDLLKQLQQSYQEKEGSLKTQINLPMGQPQNQLILCDYRSCDITPNENTSDHPLTSVNMMKEAKGCRKDIATWFLITENPSDKLWHEIAGSIYNELTRFDFGFSEYDLDKLFKLYSIAANKNEFSKTMQKWAQGKDQLEVLSWMGTTIYSLYSDLRKRSMSEIMTSYAISYITEDENLALIDQLQTAQAHLQENYIKEKTLWNHEIATKYSGISIKNPAAPNFAVLYGRFIWMKGENEKKLNFLPSQFLPILGISDETYLSDLEKWISDLKLATNKDNSNKTWAAWLKEKGSKVGCVVYNTLSRSQCVSEGNHELFLRGLDAVQESINQLKGKGLPNLSDSKVSGTHKVEVFDSNHHGQDDW